ncbi:MAG: hypothetical protein KF760_09315 [Candidatus Eremiobacteraeota bacterium]|nr:hypothetical protein [Candidatus Eremiobacteraeota bacterium]
MLYSQQANRLLVMGQQSLASSGGTASLCGGAAGPGGGPAGAGGASLSGASAVAAGGSNGACGGVPVGGQETGRSYHDYSASPQIKRASPYFIDDLAWIAPLLPPGFGGGLLRSSGSVGAGGVGLAGGLPSNHGIGTTDMERLGIYKNRPVPKTRGGPTCPSNKKQ